MKNPSEIELKFIVPAASRAAVSVEMAKASPAERVSLAARYLDTADRHLARAGLAWRLRREGRRWVQALKGGGSHVLERFEHEVVRPDATFEAQAHAGTWAGDELLRVLAAARADGLDVGVRFQTQVRRTLRRVRTRGAVVEVAFDEGRLIAGTSSLRICELEFELLSGSASALVALAERWRERFGLLYEPRTKAERGDRLAAGARYPAVRKAARPDYLRDATAAAAFGQVLDECLLHITHNAVGLCDGDPGLQAEHVHQTRVGIRRLRSALRCFEGWTPAPDPALVDGLRSLFTELGQARDSDVLKSGVAAELARAGAPPIPLPATCVVADPADAVRSGPVQRLILAWIGWRISLAPAGRPNDGAAGEPAQREDDAWTRGDVFRRKLQRRLGRWHDRLAAAWEGFGELDEAALHALRKRIKRQRYAVEFFAPLLHRRSVEKYLKPLALVQDRMGELNDLFVAKARYEQLVAADPAAWFALGWLTARIAEVRQRAHRELGQLARAELPRR